MFNFFNSLNQIEIFFLIIGFAGQGLFGSGGDFSGRRA